MSLIEIVDTRSKRAADTDAQRRCQAAIDAERSTGAAYELAYCAFERLRSEENETRFQAARERYAAAAQRLAAARAYVRTTLAAIQEPASEQRQEARREAHAALTALEPPELEPTPRRRRWRPGISF